MSNNEQPQFIKLVSGDGRFIYLANEDGEDAALLARKMGFEHAVIVSDAEYFAYFAVARHGFVECMNRHESFSSARLSALLTENAAFRRKGAPRGRELTPEEVEESAQGEGKGRNFEAGGVTKLENKEV